MRQVIPHSIKKANKTKSNKIFKKKKVKTVVTKKYGTSKLEKDFASDFLDKLNLNYIYQYEAKDIKRYYDFAITCLDSCDYKTEVKDGIRCIAQNGQYFSPDLLIEVDGSYFHSDPRIISEDKLTPMHKHNKFVDKQKDMWAGLHCIPLLRIWEYDIRNNPKKVMEEILKYVADGRKKQKILHEKKKPH